MPTSDRVIDLPNGLYAVIQDDRKPIFCAGFIVRDHLVRKVDCAPIIWRKLAYWAQQARVVTQN